MVSSVVREPGLSAADRWSLYADFDRALGFGLAGASDPEAADVVGLDEIPAEMADLLARRDEARRARDFVTAGALRDQLAEAGFEIVDTPDGSSLRRSQ